MSSFMIDVTVAHWRAETDLHEAPTKECVCFVSFRFFKENLLTSTGHGVDVTFYSAAVHRTLTPVLSRSTNPKKADLCIIGRGNLLPAGNPPQDDVSVRVRHTTWDFHHRWGEDEMEAFWRHWDKQVVGICKKHQRLFRTRFSCWEMS